MSISQQVQPHRTPAPLGLVTSIIIAALGGFVGGMLIEHGPTYLNVHVTQPVLGQRAEQVESFSAAPAELPVGIASPVRPDILAIGAESRIVVHANDATYLVLQDHADKSWGKGRIRSSNDDGLLVTMRQSVKVDALPTGQRAWLGEPVTLFDSRGYACSATVEKIEILEQYAGDGMVLEAWDEYGGGPLLAARLAKSKGNCKAAVWGRHAHLEAPRIGRISKGTKSERREARKAFRATAAHRDLQTQYEDAGLKGHWDTFWEGTLSISVVRSPEQELIFVQAQVGGCGEFDAQLGSIFERQDDGTLRALPSDNEYLSRIEAAADIDGDGDLDFVTQGDAYDRALNVYADNALHVDTHSAVNIYYCRC